MKTRDKIIQAALKLFVAQGIHKTSTSQICKEVGIASGSLFVHFKTKQELIDTIYLEKKKQAFASMHENLDYSEPAKTVVFKSSEFMVGYYLKHFEEFQFFQMLEKGPVISAQARKLYKKEAAQSVELIKAWQKEGALKSLDTQLLMDIWWGILSAFIRNLHEQKQKQVKRSDLEVIWEALGQ